MLFSFTRYVDRYGRSMKLVDRTRGVPLVCDTVAHFVKNMGRKVQSVAKAVLPHRNATGTYVMRDGKMVKVGSSARVFDVWISKHGMFPDQGDRERHNFYVNQDQKGLLNDVDDRSVWEPLRKKYGRDKVRVM